MSRNIEGLGQYADPRMRVLPISKSSRHHCFPFLAASAVDDDAVLWTLALALLELEVEEEEGFFVLVSSGDLLSGLYWPMQWPIPIAC
jgi:hypothetical protein